MAVKKTIKKEISKKDFRVTILDSARIKKNDKHYKQGNKKFCLDYKRYKLYKTQTINI